MIITTTPTVEGKHIREYRGIVTGEAILGANIFTDFSAAYEKELRRARETAMQEMSASAQEQGANAIVGVDLDYEVLGQNNGMLMVSISGTAVIVE
jgi:uncharacterized protein YbjQ (UPF0145 family)